jgi:chorismate dehydratase
MNDISGFSQEGAALKLKISLVQYLNAAPLGWSFLHGPLQNQFEISLASPARCAVQLARGEVDIGLIPAIEYQRINNLMVIPEVAIAATNDVRSVLLVRRCGSLRLDSVALDTSSRTSAVLVKLLLNSRMGLHPEFVPHEPNLGEMLGKCDAALLIGDAALRCTPEKYEITDLAAAWRDWQRKPFVFAFWACRAAATLPKDLADVFLAAKEWGVQRFEEIAAAYAHTLDLPAAFLEGYLRNNLEHDMSPAHLEGLERFYRLAHEAGMIETPRSVRFIGEEYDGELTYLK